MLLSPAILAQSASSPITLIDWNSSNLLAVGRTDGTLEIVDGLTENILQSYDFIHAINKVVWHPTDENKLAIAQVYGIVGIIDINSPQETIFFNNENEWITVVSSIAWSPDGSMIAGAVSRQPFPDKPPYIVMIWDATTGEIITTLQEHHDTVVSVAWSPNGTKIISGGADESAIIWDIGSSLPIIPLGSIEGLVTSVTWNLDGTQVAIASIYDYPLTSSIQIWDATNGDLLEAYSSQYVLDIEWNTSDNLIAIANGESLQILDIAKEEINDVFQLESIINAIAWSPNKDAIALGGSTGELYIIPILLDNAEAD